MISCQIVAEKVKLDYTINRPLEKEIKGLKNWMISIANLVQLMRFFPAISKKNLVARQLQTFKLVLSFTI